MGGIGSGRRCQCGKRTTASMLRLDIRRVQRAGRLWVGNMFAQKWTWALGTESATVTIHVEIDRLVLSYRSQSVVGDVSQSVEYPVDLDWTTLHYGGRRPWFLCPASGCGRRVAVLYGDGGRFACRQCQWLAYKSQGEAPCKGVYRRIDKLRARLKWKPGFAHGIGPGPKGMHQRTFERLIAQYLAEMQIVSDDVERLTARVATIER